MLDIVKSLSSEEAYQYIFTVANGLNKNVLEELINKNLQMMRYTAEHMNIVQFIAGRKVNSNKYLYHDADKLVMKLFGIQLGKETIQRIHRDINLHHCKHSDDIVVNREKVFDYESARFNKPDKPKNARETIEAYYVDESHVLMPIVKELGLYNRETAEYMEFERDCKRYYEMVIKSTVNEGFLLNYILEYLNNNKERVFNGCIKY